MARITVEDCLKKVDNRFELIHLSAKRVRQLRKGFEPMVESKNTDIVISLREIAAGKVFPADKDEEQGTLLENEEILETQEVSEKPANASPIDKIEEDNQEETSLEE